MAARGNRDRMVIATKVGKLPGLAGLSAKTIRAAAEGSLRRLRTDRIDLYYAHADDAATPLEETLGAFDALVREGKVRQIAASNHTEARLAEALAVAKRNGLARYVALQPHYNLVHRPEYESGLAALCVREQLACFPYYALASGFLAGKYRPGSKVESQRASSAAKYLDDRGLRILAALDAIAAARGTTVAAVALAWLLTRPGVVAPIASARTPEQLAELLPLASMRLDRERAAAPRRRVGVNPETTVEPGRQLQPTISRVTTGASSHSHGPGGGTPGSSPLAGEPAAQRPLVGGEVAGEGERRPDCDHPAPPVEADRHHRHAGSDRDVSEPHPPSGNRPPGSFRRDGQHHRLAPANRLHELRHRARAGVTAHRDAVQPQHQRPQRPAEQRVFAEPADPQADREGRQHGDEKIPVRRVRRHHDDRLGHVGEAPRDPPPPQPKRETRQPPARPVSSPRHRCAELWSSPVRQHNLEAYTYASSQRCG